MSIIGWGPKRYYISTQGELCVEQHMEFDNGDYGIRYRPVSGSYLNPEWLPLCWREAVG
jgi:hypothetical protein